MYIEYLNRDISSLQRAPQIVRERQGFYTFIKSFSEYIDESSKQIYDVVSKITQIISTSYAKNLDLNYLKRLIIKCGINIQWLAMDADTDTIRQVYFMAIQGFVVKRLSDASKHNLLELLNIIFGSSASVIEVNDEFNMSYTADIKGVKLDNVQSYYAYYIKPAITAVNSQFSFSTNGTFASMPWNGNEEVTPSSYNITNSKFEIDGTEYTIGTLVNGYGEITPGNIPVENYVFTLNDIQYEIKYFVNDYVKVCEYFTNSLCTMNWDGEKETVIHSTTSIPIYESTGMWQLQLK